MGRLNNRARMTTWGQFIWGVQRVDSEPSRTLGRYSLWTNKCSLLIKIIMTKCESDICLRNMEHNITYFARHCVHTTRRIKWGWNRVVKNKVWH